MASEHIRVKYQKKEGKLLANTITISNSQGRKITEKAPEMAPTKGPEKHG